MKVTGKKGGTKREEIGGSRSTGTQSVILKLFLHEEWQDVESEDLSDLESLWLVYKSRNKSYRYQWHRVWEKSRRKRGEREEIKEEKKK